MSGALELGLALQSRFKNPWFVFEIDGITVCAFKDAGAGGDVNVYVRR